MIAPFLDWMTTAEFFPSPIHIHIRYLWLLRVGQRGVSFWCDRCWIPGVFFQFCRGDIWLFIVTLWESVWLVISASGWVFSLASFSCSLRMFLIWLCSRHQKSLHPATHMAPNTGLLSVADLVAGFLSRRRLFACILGISPGLFQCLLSVIGAESDRQVVPTQQGNTNMCQKRVLLWITLFGGMG